MPLIPLGNWVAPDALWVFSGPTPSGPRPLVTDVSSVISPVLRPPVGYRADYVVVPTQLVMARNTVSDANGHTIAYTLINTIAPIFYTLDGTTPVNHETASSKRYLGPVQIRYPTYPRNGATITVKAQAFALAGSGFLDSAIDTLTCQIPRQPVLFADVDNTPDPLVKDITFLSNFSGDFLIRWTQDGTDPTGTSTPYSGTFLLIGTLGATITLKAVAFPNSVIGLMGGIIQSEVYEVQVGFVV